MDNRGSWRCRVFPGNSFRRPNNSSSPSERTSRVKDEGSRPNSTLFFSDDHIRPPPFPSHVLPRYRKGDAIKWAGREWYDMHADIMIVASEAVLPLGITAVFASRGRTSAAHAHWGYYMIGAVALQIFTGWLRTKGLEAKHSNFSLLHRVRSSTRPSGRRALRKLFRRVSSQPEACFCGCSCSLSTSPLSPGYYQGQVVAIWAYRKLPAGVRCWNMLWYEIGLRFSACIGNLFSSRSFFLGPRFSTKP